MYVPVDNGVYVTVPITNGAIEFEDLKKQIGNDTT